MFQELLELTLYLSWLVLVPQVIGTVANDHYYLLHDTAWNIVVNQCLTEWHRRERWPLTKRGPMPRAAQECQTLYTELSQKFDL